MRTFISFMFLLFSPTFTYAQTPHARLPIPDEAAQKRVTGEIADAYKVDYQQAQTAEQKIALAKKLLAEGIATRNDANGRYVLWRISRDIAVQQADLPTALVAIHKIADEYDVDRLQLSVDAATTVVKLSKNPVVHGANVKNLISLIDEAVALDRYGEAKTLIELALTGSRAARDSEQTKRLLARQKELETLEVEFLKLQDARETLEAKPTDPLANLSVGRYHCFIKGEWSVGIPMLALGSDEKLKEVARRELADSSEPVSVADAWWDIAEAQAEPAKKNCRLHAAELYQKAIPTLTGLAKAKAESRLALCNTTMATTIDLLAMLDPAKHTLAGEWKMEKAKDASILRVCDSARWRDLQKKGAKGGSPKIRLPLNKIPADYTLCFEVTRREIGLGLNIGIIVEGRQANVVVDGFRTAKASGLELIDGNSAKENETTSPGEFLPLNQPVLVRIAVKEKEVALSCDNKPIFRWSGNSQRLQLPESWRGDASGSLYLGCQAQFDIRKIWVELPAE